jgi:hypothetical protein
MEDKERARVREILIISGIINASRIMELMFLPTGPKGVVKLLPVAQPHHEL